MGIFMSRLTVILLSLCTLGSSLGLNPTWGERSAIAAEKILIRRFNVTLVRKSRSTRVYLFSQDLKKDPELSSRGKIILIKRDNTAVMAFRVLRAYGAKDQFAAKVLKNYRNGTPLAGDTFLAVEKIGSKSEIALSAMDEKDLQELEQPPEFEPDDPNLPSSDPNQTGDDQDLNQFEVLAYDPELDAGSSPPPTEFSGARNQLPDELDPYDERSLIAEEITPLDPDPNWLSFMGALIRNPGLERNNTTTPVTAVESGSINVGGFGLRYGYTVADRIFLRDQEVQDSLVPEIGFYYYSITNYTDDQDSYTLLPVLGNFRYNLLAGETYGFFLYLGFMQNFVLSSENDRAGYGSESLGSTRLAMGGGLLFHVGPNWNVRVDIGIENIGAGLVLRF